jgi:hypothetical protein
MMSDRLLKESDVLKAINKALDRETLLNRFVRKIVVDAIIQVPSVERPRGEWIEVDDSLISCRCSVCGWEAHLYEDDVYGMPYCPNCGAEMKGADDGNK